MSKSVGAVLIAGALLVSACAIHPLPEDVTGVPTRVIARKIRCEARDALKDNLVQWLTAEGMDPAVRAIGMELADGRRPLKTFNANLFSGDVRTIVEKFQNSAIGYDFSFDMTETDFFDPTFGIGRTLKHTVFSEPFSGGIDRTRENIRTFTITDTFLKLFTTIDDDYCSPYTHDTNYIYPITGRIGIGEMIHTFVELSLFDNLTGKSGPPTIADTITFTTKLSASTTPSVVLTPVTTAVHLTNASLTASFSRNDVHKVIVALSLPAPPAKGAASAKSSAPRVQVGLFVNASGTPAELTVAHTIEQVILRFEVGKSAAVVPGG